MVESASLSASSTRVGKTLRTHSSALQDVNVRMFSRCSTTGSVRDGSHRV